jgi:hypothetical protein
VGEFATKTSFWPEVLETASETGIREIRNKADEVRELTGWECPVDRVSVEALCQLPNILVNEEKQCMQDKVDSSHIPENQNNKNAEVPLLEIASNIEQWTDQLEVFEKRIPDSRMDQTSVEALCQLHDVVVDEKRQNMEEPSISKVNSSAILMSDVTAEHEILESEYAKTHWSRATSDTPVQLDDTKEPVVALIDHGSEINLISKQAYRRDKWPIDIDHGCKIQATTKSTDELFASRRETKVLDIGATFAGVRNFSGSKSMQLLTVSRNHACNTRELLYQTKMDIFERHGIG